MTTVNMSDSSKLVVENITKLICDLVKLKTNLILEKKQETQEHQKQLYFLNQVLETYLQKKRIILGEQFEYTPCTIRMQQQNSIMNITNNDNHVDNSENEEEDEDNDTDSDGTESEYVFSDVDEEEEKQVVTMIELAEIKLARNTQNKLYIHITQTHT